jgi:bifunctional DNase/RNase
MPEELPGDDDLNLPPSFFPSEPQGEEPPQITLGEPIEVQIEGVYMAEKNGSVSHFVLLTDGERKLPILIGPFEAHAISLALENGRSDRPMTHDLLKTVIEKLDGDIDRVVIDDLWNTTYYAKIFLQKGDVEIGIDSRPSDAIAVAVRFDVPVYVSDGILEASEE